jgi:hypothetical protein
VGLFVLGRGGDEDSGTTPSTSAGTTTTKTTKKEQSSSTSARPRVATLKIIPTGQLYVCLRDAAGRRLLDGVVLQPDAATKTFRSRRLRLTLGNGDARLVVNGSPRAVPDVEQGIGYSITADSFTRLSGDERPSCT